MQGCYHSWHMWGVPKSPTLEPTMLARAKLPAGGPWQQHKCMQIMHSNSHVLLDLQPVVITDALRDNLLCHGSLSDKEGP